MAFDWRAFLDRHGISYQVQKKDLYIHCPFCGASDGGRHMGVSVVGKGWGCWKQNTHRGRSPERLIQALLGCSWVEAQRLAGSGAGPGLTAAGGFMAAVEGALGKAPPAGTPGPLLAPKEFRPLQPPIKFLQRPFWEYLGDRGFTGRQVETLADHFDLRWCMEGEWAYRLIIPVRDHTRAWCTWTGRAINDNAKVRYKTLTADPDKAGVRAPVARGPITNMLLDMPNLVKGGDTLVIAEGPFDAMRLSLFAGEYNARATCLFGKAISKEQVDLLAELRPLYRDMVLLLDPDAALDAMTLQTRMAPLAALSHLLQGDDDPGEMSPSAIRDLMRELPKTKRRAVVRPAAHKGD